MKWKLIRVCNLFKVKCQAFERKKIISHCIAYAFKFYFISFCVHFDKATHVKRALAAKRTDEVVCVCVNQSIEWVIIKLRQSEREKERKIGN